MTKGRVITLRQIEAAGVCAEELSRLKRLFGDQVTLTEAWAEEHAIECDWDRAAWRLLSAEAMAHYVRVAELAMSKYFNVTLYAKCRRIRDAALLERQRTKAVAFARLYIAEKRPRPANPND